MSESNFFPENAAESILSPASGTAPEAISSPLSASAASISESFSDVPIPVSGRPGTSVHDAGSFSNTIYFQLNTSRYQLEEAVRVGSYAMKYRHYHATYEIYYLMEGQRYYFIDRSVFSVRPGSLVFVRKNRIHKTSQAEGDRHRRLLIEIDAACMDRWLSEMAGGKLSALFHDDQCVLTLTADQRAVLEAKLNEIRLEAEKKEEGWEEMVEYLLRQILLFSFRVKTSGTVASESAARESVSPFPDSEKIRTVNRVAGYLADHYWEQTSLDELSSRFFINKFYLSRIFRQVTGFTMREYLHIQRIQKAQEFLRSSQLPITEISLSVGFETVSYFEKIFRRYCSQSPREYRNTHQKSKHPAESGYQTADHDRAEAQTDLPQ